MITFGSGMSAAATATIAARDAATEALRMLRGERPKLAIVFVSASYPDVHQAARTVRAVVGDAQIIGGTSGACVFAGEHVGPLGVSVVLLAGADIEVESHTAPIEPPTFFPAVPAAEKVAKAAGRAALAGLSHFVCLVFAPLGLIDGEALTAAVRKGAGAHAQLAGAITGDDLTMDRAKVLFGDELRDDCLVVTGLFTRRPIGIAARHGWAGVGRVRTVTRSDGPYLLELDGQPALDVWLDDARAAGGTPPAAISEVALYLGNHYSLGLADDSVPRIAIADDKRELVARTPFAIREDRAIQLSAAISEGARVRVLHATREDLLRASREAAATAAERAGGSVAGALVLACAGRLAALGDTFAEEPAAMRAELDAPIGGACVFGEIARNVRDVDAFFNMTSVVVAFPK